MAEKNSTYKEDPAEVSPPVARIISKVPREKWIDLDWPVEFDGVIYEKIRIKRITAVELSEYFKKLEDTAAAGGEFPMPPVVDCPLAVWRALDSDDEMKVDEASMDFMPPSLEGGGRVVISQWREYVGLVSDTFSTQIPTVMSWDWIEVLEWYCTASNFEMSRLHVQLMMQTRRLM